MPINGVVFGLDSEKIEIICDACGKYKGGGWTISSVPDAWRCKACGFWVDDLRRKIKALAKTLPMTKKPLTIEDAEKMYIGNIKSPTDHLDGEELLVKETLVREIRDAKRWITILEANEALMAVRKMAEGMRKEILHNAGYDKNNCGEKEK